MGKNLSKVGKRRSNPRRYPSQQIPPPESMATSLASEADKAVLTLKVQRDEVSRLKAKLESNEENERAIINHLLQRGKRDQAILLLKKSRFQQYVLEQSGNQLESMLMICNSTEYHKVETDVNRCIEEGELAIKKLEKIMSLESIEKVLEEGQDGEIKLAEIERVLLLSTDAEQRMLEKGLEDELQKFNNTVSTANLIDLSRASNTVIVEEIVEEDTPFQQSNDSNTIEVLNLAEDPEGAVPLVDVMGNATNIGSFTSVTSTGVGRKFTTEADSESEFVDDSELHATQHTIHSAKRHGRKMSANFPESDVESNDLPLKSTAEISDLLPDVPAKPSTDETGSISQSTTD